MEKLCLEQAIWLVSQQDALNKMVDPEWRTTGYPYLRGVVTEAVEAMDHYGWKWWTQQRQDLFQLQLELVDILCFSLSQHISEYQGDLHSVAKELVGKSHPQMSSCCFNGRNVELKTCDVPQLLEMLIGFAVRRENMLSLLEVIFQACELPDWACVIARYDQKFALHVYRQLNGYRDGRYLKVWKGREDCVHLAMLSAPMGEQVAGHRPDLLTSINNVRTCLLRS